MTCIVAVVQDGKVTMGGDSAGVADLSVTNRSDVKVFKNGPYIIGFTSSFRMGQILHYTDCLPDPPARKSDLLKFMSTDFIDCIKLVFKVNGYGRIGIDGQDEGGKFLVGVQGRLFTIDVDFQVGVPRLKYDSVGCGSEIALGSLHTTNKWDLTASDRIKMALQASVEFSAGVRPPFKIVGE